MAVQIKNSFLNGMDLDRGYLRVGPDVSVWMKDCTTGVNYNPNVPTAQGANEGLVTPMEGNYQVIIATPSGLNYCIGFYSSEQTNEGYFFIYNSTGSHTIWVINGDTGATALVYEGSLLNFQLSPVNFLSEGRVTMWLQSYIDPVSGNESNYKFLIFTDNFNNQFYIEVSSSIATSSYSTSHFTASAAFYNPLELISLGVPTPLSNIGLNTPVSYTPTSADANLQNLLIRNGWQFRVKFIDIFGRESEHGIISAAYITIIGGGCVTASNGLPRCLVLNFDAGNPMVNQVIVEYRQWVGNQPVVGLQTGWLQSEVFYKYDTSGAVEWYNRSYNPLFTTAGTGITFNPSTNQIAYTFCADKNQIPVDPTETARTEPDIPLQSSSLGIVNTSLALANNVRNYDPISPDAISKVNFLPQLPASAPCPPAPLRTITVYACIWNVHNQTFQHYNTTGGSTPLFTFGAGSGTDGSTTFGDQTNPGFIAYIASTPYNCIGVQGSFNPATGGFTPVPISTTAIFPNIPVVQFTIVDVPAMKGLIRISSHLSTLADGDYQQTSTYVGGICSILTLSVAGRMIGSAGYASNPLKEIEFDATSANVVYNNPSDPMFTILDNNGGSGKLAGYLYEQVGQNVPVEMSPIYLAATSGGGTVLDASGSFFTDHNGFFFVFVAASGLGEAKSTFYFDDCTGPGVRTWKVYNAANTLFPYLVSTGLGITYGDGSGTTTGAGGGPFVHGFWKNRIYLYPSTATYPVGARITITQQIFACGSSTIGVPGIPLTQINSQSSSTNTSGVATFIAHNRYNYATVFGSLPLPWLGLWVPSYAPGSGRENDNLVISQKGGCEWTTCAGTCSFYLADIFVPYAACTGSARVTTLSSFTLNLSGVGISGLTSGGKYQGAFWALDFIGRHTDPMPCNFFFTPNLNDANYQQFALCQARVDIYAGFSISFTFTKLAFLLSQNVLFSDFIDWNADWVQFIDNTGNTNNSNPTAIRIYYGSLNEYNKQYSFNTNCAWQPITDGQPGQSPVEGDVIQFIANGQNGVWLPSVISAPITYDKNGLFFTLDYIPELASITNGCLFRIIRPYPNTTGQNIPLYEQCLIVPLTGGVPASNISGAPVWVSGNPYAYGAIISYSGVNYVNILALTSSVTAPNVDTTHWKAILASYILPYYDSYLLQRLIPVPILKGQPGAIAPGGTPVNPIQYSSTGLDSTLLALGYTTNNVNNNNGVVAFQFQDTATSSWYFYESPSPADTWGSHIACLGREGFVNPYGKQQRNGTEIAISAAYGERSNFNGLSYFEDNNIETFDRNVYGDITVIIIEQGEILVICNNDYFTTRYNQSQLMISKDGLAAAQNQNGIFTAPVTKKGSNYGCIPFNINTIRRYEGIVVWVDSKYGLILYNGNEVTEISSKGGFLSYILNKLNAINQLNQLESIYGLNYLISGIDPKTMEYYFSSWHLPKISNPVSYLNTTNSDVNLSVNETMVIDLLTGQLKRSASFTPEYYGMIPGYLLQKQFISFNQGQPYLHHTGSRVSSPTPYAQYYGTQCYPRVTAVFNLSPEDVKRYLYIEIYTNSVIPGSSMAPNTALMLCDIITTEKGQQSRLLTGQWKLVDGYQCAAFLCDLNTPYDPNLIPQTTTHQITDGNPLMGRWIKVSFIPQSVWGGTYYEVSSVCVYVNGVAPSNGNSK